MTQAQATKAGSVPDEVKKEAVATSEKVLVGLEAISDRARAELARGPVGSNMGFNAEASGNHLQILGQCRQSAHVISNEPALARVEVRWKDTGKVECFFMTRGSAAGIVPPALEGKLVSYKAGLGRLAEFAAGDDAEVRTDMGHRECQILNRALVNPLLIRGVWDARNNRLETLSQPLKPQSLLDLIEQWGQSTARVPAEVIDYFSRLQELESATENLLEERHRQTIEKMALRDQAVLDKYQGEIFRMPLQSQLMLFGPPGTGKTTTLIKRLAQKRVKEALTSEESDLLEESRLSDLFLEDTSWVMYSPTDLLKLYVKEAFAKEGVAASSVNIRTWDNQRFALGKETLRVLRSATDGTGFLFAPGATVLARAESARLSAMHDRVAEHVDKVSTDRFREAAEWLREDETEMASPVRRSLARINLKNLTVGDIYDFGARNQDIQPLLKRLRDSNRDLQRTLFNRLVAPNAEERLSSLTEFLAKKGTAFPAMVMDDDDGLDGEASTAGSQGNATKAPADELMRMIGRWAVSQAEGREARNLRDFEAWVGDRVPRSGDLKSLGQQMILLRKLQVLVSTPRTLVYGVPAIYRKFRRDLYGDRELFAESAKTCVDANQISPDELDLLILLMLRNARRARGYDAFAWLDEIEAQYRLQVYVDEVTDFSAVQLACMLELSHPSLRSWFACGDFRQRITAHGIASVQELEWIRKAVGLTDEISTQSIKAVYRQTPRLLEFADAFDKKSADLPGTTYPRDPAPLLFEKSDQFGIGAWLAARIVEVEKTVQRLPSVAIFVDGEEQIDPLLAVLRPHFAQHNLPVVACRDGHAIGDVQEVRVFDIRHVKGLEFEAVFFVGVDQLERRMPNLFDRFLYVGMTRAATFLGMTCGGSLPNRLSFLRPLLSDGTWSD